MKNIFNLFNRNHKHNLSKVSPEYIDEKETTDLEHIREYKNEINELNIENQPFRLSGILHILTNKVASSLQDNGHTIYYDVENNVGRYIVGDNYYIEQVLLVLVEHAMMLNKDAEVVLKVSKIKNKFLVFDVINQKAVMPKEVFKQYTQAFQMMGSQSEKLNTFVKIKMMANAMHGSIDLKSTKALGTHYTFTIPYYEDKDDRSHQEKLKFFLEGKKALFIGKDDYDTKRTQYIFETYGIHIHTMKLDDFEKKKPNLSQYNMAIMRSADLSYRHISFFKSIFQDDKSDFKIIIVHELFEDEEKIKLCKSIAHAELYSPTVIGDVEEILYQIFILKSKAVKGINNIEVFNAQAFTIRGNNEVEFNHLEHYKGANIAIVEDSKVDEKILQNILMKDGITLFCMHNGAEMIDLLENEEIDIIFTDINMPIMDGLLMTKKIRTMEKYKKIPIISISSMAFPHELKKMELVGINAAITKPIEAKDVYMALKIFLIITEKIRMRKRNKSQINFAFNKEILDVSKGIQHSQSNLEYFEKLVNTIEYMRDTKESFENMIYDEKLIALGTYTMSSLTMYEEIHAPKMIQMFKDLNYFISQDDRTHLGDYISIYQKNWKALEVEVEKYVNTM